MMNEGGSRRARRMERHHKAHKGAPLNLVSLMDIFTILVFFLLVNSSSTPQLPNNKDLILPDSTAQKAPKETLLLVITRDDILLQGKKLTGISALLESDEEVIAPLLNELNYYGQLNANGQEADAEGFAITILGDENADFELINRIMATCQQANFTKISFAANRKVSNSQ